MINETFRKLDFLLMQFSEFVHTQNPGMSIGGYQSESIKDFEDAFEFELARLRKDREVIKRYYDTYLKDTVVYNDWLQNDLNACDVF